MVDASSIGGAAGKYAYIGLIPSAGFKRDDWQVEYGTAAYVGDNPLDSNADGVADFNPLTGRYEGEWAAMRATRCDDLGIVNWNTDPTVVGIDNVNIIRVTAIDPTVTALEPGQNIRLFLPLEVRETFNGSAYAGTSIPPGTVIATMSTFRSDEVSPAWRNMRYVPSPETPWGVEGDRVTTTGITIDLVKSTHTPFAAAGVTQAVLAGNDVVWQIDPVVSSLLPNGGVAKDLTIVDTLPVGISYNPSCTQALANGTAPDLVEYGMPAAGQTKLTWFLGDVLSTVSQAPKIFCTTTDSLAEAGTVLQNSAAITASNATVPAVTSQGISLGQTGSIQTVAAVDSVIDSPDDDQQHTLSWYNFSTAGNIAAPTIINVLPFNGDGAGASIRGPASNFTGTFALAGEPIVTFSDGSVPGASEPVIGTLSYTADAASGVNHDPNVNTSIWCEFDGANFVNPSSAGACPASFADVSAVRHVSNYNLEPDGNPRQGLVMKYTALATNNTAGDAYTNIFALDSNSLPAGQSVIAQSGVVQIASFSIGDFIFADVDNDGVYTAGVDLPSPDGTPVELRLSSDDSLIASSTTTNGTYLFDGLSDGDYYVQVPASIFDSSQPFGAWNAAVLSQPANLDANQEVDHSGTVLANVATDGVRTDTVTLSAAQPTTVGGAPTGEEPVGDNTFGINDANTDDAFSNLTIDIGLLSGDADADGIPDVVEFGGSNLSALLDSDGDGTADYLDTDSDNDGIADSIEAGTAPATPVDTDGDGVLDYLDIDSDDDGFPDSVEGIVDLDGDNKPDYIDFSNPPVATADTATVAADTMATVSLAGNITDADNDQALATIDLDPTTAGVQSTLTTAEGVWTVDVAGDLTFDPVSSFAGVASIPYTVQDATGLVSNSANVSVTVATASPMVTADSASVLADIDALIDLSDNVSDANNDVDITTIDLDSATAGVQNTLTTADGVWSVDAAGRLAFDPVVTFEGTTSTPYTVADLAGNVSAPAVVTVTVSGAIPMATNDQAMVAADTIANIDLSDNVSDANNNLDITTIDLDPTVAGIQNTLTTIHGDWAVDAAGLVTFDPVASFDGNSSIFYTVSDDNSNTSGVANITVNVAGAIPIASNDTATVSADTIASVDLSDNITDANNDIAITTIDLDPTVAGIQNTLTTIHGAWAVDAAGLVTFDPVASFEGTSAITYTVSDDDGNVSMAANIIVTVAGATPMATADSATVLADTIAAIDLADNVTDANNDIDITTIDLDPATDGVQSTLTTTDGVWSVDPAGLVSFDPTAAFEGISTIGYTVADANGNIATPSSVTVTVGGAIPMASNDQAMVAADTIASIDLSDNVSDANNNLDITTIDLDPTVAGIQNTLTTIHGDWAVDAAGLVTFDPVASFEGNSSISYTVSDDNGNTSSVANITVNVAGATPMASNDTATVAADTNASVDLSDNITDANNDIDITTIDLDPTVAGIQNTLTTIHGAWAVDAAGLVSFDPVASFEGTSAITYTVSDDDGNVSMAANIIVTVAGATPMATADSATVLADTNAAIDLADNVTDANNDIDITTIDLDPATPGVQSTLTTAEGDWSVDPVGMVTFDPISTFEGLASIAYTVSDDDGNISMAANVSVSVAGAAPIATTDSATVLADTNATVDLADNVTDANNDLDITTIDLDPATAGVQNTLTTTDGVWSVDPAGLVSFDPASAFEGVSAIAYTVADANGNIATPSTVTVTVDGATPMASNDQAMVAADTIASIDLSDNVSDANNNLDITTIDLDPAVAGIQNTLTTIHGDWAVDATGLVTFDPVASFEGNSSISYTVSDDNGNTSGVANITVNVAGATPMASNDTATVAADAIASVDLSDNVTDANNDIDIATIDLDPTVAGIQNTLTTIHGAWAVDAAGLVTFDPVASFEGTSAIAYTVSDDDGNVSMTANIIVTVAGATPMATADSATVLADTNAAIDLADNVTDANNDIDITTIDLDPATPGVQITLTTAEGDWSVDPVGMVTFDPVSTFEGSASIAYTVSDDDGNVSMAANVSVAVAGAAPIVTADSATVLADTNATVDLADNVTDANNDLDITTIDLDPATAGVQNTLTTADGVWSVDPAGLVSFDPTAAFEGVSAIAYTVADANGNIAIPSMVTVTVGGATPIVTNDTATVAADTIASLDLSDNISDANNDLDITTIDLDSTVAGVQSTLTTIHGAWSVDPAGLVTFDPVSSFEGTSAIAYTVTDDDGNIATPANILVTVGGATPMVTNDGAAAPADTIASLDLSDNVSDANNDIDITTIDLDSTVAGIQNTLTTAHGTWSVDPAGIVNFDPVASFEGTSNIAYTVSDDDGNVSLPASISMTIGGATPIATADSTSVLADTNAVIDLSDNVTDANNDIDISTIDLDPATAGVQSTLTTADGNWSVNAVGIVTFDPTSAFEGQAAIPYTVQDDDANISAAAFINVTVAGAAPIATADSVIVPTNTNANVDLADNISDANSNADIATIDLDTATPGVQNTLTTADGVWSVDSAGLVSFDPLPAFEGAATIAYTVSDTDSNVSAAADVSVTVGGATPIATNDAATVIADTIASIDLSDNVSDLNSDIDLTTFDLDPTVAGIQNTLTTTAGVWAVDSAGMVTFDPAASFEGMTAIAYSISDDDTNTSAPANVLVTVGGATPMATADSASVLADTNATVDLSDNVTDANNDIDITTIDLDPATPGVQNSLATADGVWSVDAAGTVVFDPAVFYEGTTTIPYTVADDDGNVSLPSNIAVTVGSASPIADSEMETTVQNIAIAIDVLDGDNDANNDLDSTSIDLDPATPSVQTTMSVAGEGLYEVVGAQVVFTPDAVFFGNSGIGYAVSDAAGNVSNIANIDITILVDTDSDGVANVDDLDSDNDGIPNLQEGTNDTDGDGIIDSLDRDSDNDGITDASEAGGSDVDGDGIIDSFTDTDGDGLDDSTGLLPLPAEDTDADGLPNFQDLDSDNDGLTDIFEAGSTDADNNGTVDGLTDINGDGLDDAIAATPPPLTDNDTDGTADYIDTDSDNDGIPDVTEAGGADTDGDSMLDGFTDANNDGLDDAIAVTSLPVNDLDADGNPDYLDLDSDADGIPDSVEAGSDPLAPVDTDTDGLADYLDEDSDADAIPDAIEAGSNGASPVDTDADSVPDYLDLDSDADSISDNLEVGIDGFNPADSDADGIPDYQEISSDADGDGIPDSVEGIVDTDADGIPDYLDTDSDNDGIPDAIEGSIDSDADGIADNLDLDSDADGIPDNIEAGADPLVPVDTDTDGIADYLDDDSDADGIPDNVEAGANGAAPIDTDADGTADYIDIDSDSDGIPDAAEAGSNPLTPADSDADGIADYQESDSDFDNDGIPDSVEGLPDTDGDGIPDYQDLDSDNDGIPDAIEQSIDSDGDSVADNLDQDSDNDGIPDSIEAGSDPLALVDTDADGVADYLDNDSDADGIPDSVEAGSNGSAPVDTDTDGIPDYLDLDSDSDGIPDTAEAGGDPLTPTDSDADGIPDYQEGASDADNDGIPDSVEGLVDSDADGIADYLDNDSDNDGIRDAIEGSIDTDADGTPDYLDTDSDNDGITDAIEAGAVAGTPADTDGDGVADYLQTDSDSDGIPDSLEGTVDTDGDGIADYLDLDSDADGIPDSVEAGPNPATPTDTDADGVADFLTLDADADGIPDSIEAGANASVPADTDSDGTPDYIDLDSDADNIPDNVEAGSDPLAPVDTSANGIADYLDLDSDADGIPDSIEAGPTSATPLDTDADGIADYLDLDADGDNIPDAAEAGGDPLAPADANGDGTPDYQETGSDADGDGIPDSTEGTVDTDNDGIADYLDNDSDNDGIPDSVEGSIDTDADGIADYLDNDSDADGIPDAIEAGPDPLAPIDTDADGIADYIDTDSDNDTIPDDIEAGPNGAAPIDTDADGQADYIDTDADGDNVPDALEAGSDPLNPADSDGDGTPDYREGGSDSDGDGIPDSVEGTVDSDNDGIADYLDNDSDNDGIPDSVEGSIDTDADGIADNLDDDSDSDGIPDNIEAGSDPTAPLDTDADGVADYIDNDSDADGIPDAVEAGVDGNSPLDTDADGIADYLDTDSDSDSIPDTLEAGSDLSNPVDSNGDGIADYREAGSDADGDGIPDSIEGTADTDGDGIADYLDQDSDNDGIPDAIEGSIDSDADGIADYLDQDSDNDGLPDSVEAGSDPSVPVDTDADGTPDYLDRESDGDGIQDSFEAGPNGSSPLDTDGDGIPEYLDLDSDNDGIPDAAEAGSDPLNPADSDADGIPDFREGGSDSDSDGIPDSVEGTEDTDGDGIQNYLDTDSDNDSIPDSVELAIDTDGDLAPDYLDIDADNDGILDIIETTVDTDADGVANFRDLDSDNDGIYDLIEARIGLVEVMQLDANNDGVVDLSHPMGRNGMIDSLETAADSGSQNYTLPDIDADGIADYLDLDSDNDGQLDTNESDHIDQNIDGTLDTAIALRRTIQVVSPEGLAPDAGGLPRNTDGDALADFRDGDSDNDGILDIIESFGAALDKNSDGMLDNFADSNGDGVDDNWQAAPSLPADTDGDGLADAIEIDSDNDSISDLIESGSTDTNGDGTIDGFLDSNTDGIDDTVAAVPSTNTDTDGDGAPDFQDIDSDNDGISDAEEANRALTTGAALPDTDGDGTPDYQEAESGLIRTGLEGGGCVIAQPTHGSMGVNPIDPMLPAMGLFALLSLSLRRLRLSVSKSASVGGNKKD